jgi:hypothetical protein
MVDELVSDVRSTEDTDLLQEQEAGMKASLELDSIRRNWRTTKNVFLQDMTSLIEQYWKDCEDFSIQEAQVIECLSTRFPITASSLTSSRDMIPDHTRCILDRNGILFTFQPRGVCGSSDADLSQLPPPYDLSGDEVRNAHSIEHWAMHFGHAHIKATH